MYGLNSMTAPLKRVAVRKPSPSLLNADPDVWHYGPTFDRNKIEENHSAFTDILIDSGIETLWMDANDQGNADAVFTYDASLMTPQGAILMSPGKTQRQQEQELHRDFYHHMDIPIIGEITGQAHAEAGDTLWLGDNTLALGCGFRTNRAGINQICELLEPTGITVHSFDLPVYQGAAACLHLMSLVSLVSTRQALICKSLLPVGLWNLLLEMDFELIEVPYDEFVSSNTLCANLLAIAPGHCIMVDGFPNTKKRLQAKGVEIQTFDGQALCVGCEGGPTCLTRPILRQ